MTLGAEGKQLPFIDWSGYGVPTPPMGPALADESAVRGIDPDTVRLRRRASRQYFDSLPRKERLSAMRDEFARALRESRVRRKPGGVFVLYQGDIAWTLREDGRAIISVSYRGDGTRRYQRPAQEEPRRAPVPRTGLFLAPDERP